MKTRILPVIAAAAALAWSMPAVAGDAGREPPGGDYRKVSELVPLPDFIPGLGRLYVEPQTLPAGPFLAYDHKGRLVSSIYMIPISAIDGHKPFENLAVGGRKVVGVDLVYNAGHPGVPEPHYHIILWHVPKSEADLK